MELDLCLKALGDPTRFRIYQQLLIRRHCTRSLSRQLGITEAAVSQHLRVLREAGLAQREKYGHHTHYFPTREGLDFLADSFDRMRRTALTDAGEVPCQCACVSEAADDKAILWLPRKQGVTRIAVPCRKGQIFPHFGHAQAFLLVDARDGAVVGTHPVRTGSFSGSALAAFLKLQQADHVICGWIGEGARAALEKEGICLHPGCDGDALEAAKALLDGTLAGREAHCPHSASGADA